MPSDGFTNYAFLLDQNGEDADFAQLASLSNESGFDLLNLISDGTLANNDNVDAAEYAPAQLGLRTLAESGTNILVALLTIPVLIAVFTAVKRKFSYKI